jgi:cation diffusion facilitator CzcD-associated flavoprotein CzcO
VASHLRFAGLETMVLGRPMDTWSAHMPVGMFLKSTPRASSIDSPDPGHTYAGYRKASGAAAVDDTFALPIQDFIDYGLWFQKELVPDVRDERVVRLERAGSSFVASLEQGSKIEARAVVLASGLLDYSYVPPELTALGGGSLDTSLVSHASQHPDLERFNGSRLAVIGGGQSALETAAIAHEHGATVHVLARATSLRWGTPPVPDQKPQLLKPQTSLGPGLSLLTVERLAGLVRYAPASARTALVKKVLGPSGAWWLHPRFQGFDVRLGTQIVRGRPVNSALELDLDDGKQLTVDHLIAATGYRVDLNKIEWLAPGLRAELTATSATPRLSASFETPVRGLFLAGISAAPTFGPLLRFVAGTPFASPRIRRGVVRSLGNSR